MSIPFIDSKCSSIKNIHDPIIQLEDLHKLSKDTQLMVKDTKQNTHIYKQIVYDLIEWYKTNETQHNIREKFNLYYGKLMRKYRIQSKKSVIVYHYRKMIETYEVETIPRLWTLLQKRPARNISGVAVITVLTSPYPNGQRFSCKHNCYYCPNEPGQPRSYLKKEPAVARANRNDFDAFKQMNDRMRGLFMNGHEIDKLEIIIEGGTYTEYPREYLEEFHRDLVYTANTFYDSQDSRREKLSIEEEIKINATSKAKIIGICIETRPDTLLNAQTEDLKPNELKESWIHFFRRVGVTRVQLGVQHTNNDILKKVNRGHTYEDAYNAMVYLKSNCFKVDIHLMPDLPGSNPTLDMLMFDKVFDITQENSLQPDQAKIYPCEVTPWTIIQKWHKNGTYKPYAQTDERALLDVVKYGMMKCPPWVRLPRVIRDIPLSYIEGGNMFPNLRQMLMSEIEKEGKTTMDIRARECGRNMDYNEQDAVLKVRKYEANYGTEYFISFESEDEKCIFGFLRLRINSTEKSKSFIDNDFTELQDCALIREVHVYGALVPVGNTSEHTQHKGFGRKMLEKAEQIAKTHSLDRIAVISGMGVVDYYHKFGYITNNMFEIKYGLLKDKRQECFNSYIRKHRLSISLNDIKRIEFIDDDSDNEYINGFNTNTKTNNYSFNIDSDVEQFNKLYYTWETKVALVYFIFAISVACYIMFVLTF